MSKKDKKNKNKISRELTESSESTALTNSTKEISFKFMPIVTKIPNIKKSIFEFEPSVTFSTNIDYPRSEYGFHHFIHSNKNKTEKLQQFENKKKVYLVFNRFERYIDNYDNSIGEVSKEFFSSIKGIDILSEEFYKLWEIMLLFNLIDLSKEKFVSAHLAEGSGGFAQATMFYRDKYCKNGVSKNDKYYAVTLNAEDTGGNEHIPEIDSKFIEYYKKEKPQRFILHQTYSKQVAGGSKTKDNGDITDPKTIKLLGGQMDEKADFITGYGGFEWINENVQEQEAFQLIIAQIVACSKLQKKGGNFVCKFFETYTKTSLKIVMILRELYDDLYFIKPFTSRQANSEKYAVCVGFKYDEKDKEFKSISKKLSELLKTLHENKNKKEKINDIFLEFEIPNDLITSIIQLNVSISNPQLKSIGEIIAFVDKEIYAGDEYHTKRNEQIEGAEYWNNLFLQNDIKKNRTTYDDLIKNTIKISNNKIKELNEMLVYY